MRSADNMATDGRKFRGHGKFRWRSMAGLLIVLLFLVLLLCIATIIIAGMGVQQNNQILAELNKQNRREGNTRSRPNILYIMLDDLGYNDIGYHNPDVRTPYLDSLARSGRILEQHYMQQACSPSRHALMTGIYPFKTKMQHFVFRASTPLCSPINLEFLSEKLKHANYATHLVGKWHLGYCQKACLPWERGFDTFSGFLTSMTTPYTHEVAEGYEVPVYDWWDNQRRNYSTNGTHNTDLVTERTVKVLREHKSDNPFFMWVSYSAPHFPPGAPRKYLDMNSHIKDRTRRASCAMMTQADDSIRDIIQTLKDQGHYDNTIIIVASDNGGDITSHHDNSPLRGAKGSLWEGAMRTISFVAGPLITRTPSIHNGLFHVTDWHQTMLSMAGLDTDAEGWRDGRRYTGAIKFRLNTVFCCLCDGANQQPSDLWDDHLDGLDQTHMVLRGGESVRQELVHNIDMAKAFSFGQAAIRVGDFKLIWGFEGTNDGWGENCTYIWRYRPNLEQLGLDADSLLKTEDVFIGSLAKWQAEVWVKLLSQRRFDPADLSSGMTHFYNVIADPSERLDLANDPDCQADILVMKRRILELLAELVDPGALVDEQWVEAVLNSTKSGGHYESWCDDVDLNLRH